MARGISETAIFVALAGFAVAVCLPASPAYPLNPERDSGLFLYYGSRILEGDIPYRDLWDHKPPGVFYLNALGLALSGGSWWGVWMLELALVVLAVWFAYRVCTQFGTLPAIAGSATWLAIARPTGLGWNQTEGYALTMQFAAYWIWNGRSGEAMRWPRWVALGMTGAASFLLKPNIIGTWLAILVVMAMITADRRALLRGAALVLAGAAFVVGPTVVYLHVHDALAAAIDQNFHYSAVYVSGADASSRVRAAARGLQFIMTYGGAIALLYLVALPFLASRMRSGARFLALVAAADFVLEIASASLSGRTYQHYYLSILPPVAILAAAGLAGIRELLPGTQRARSLATALIALISVSGGLYTMRVALTDRTPRAGAVFRDTAVDFVRAATRQNDHLVVWGAEGTINFLSGRPAPSRYVQIWPLQTTGYSTSAMIEEFRSALDRKRPVLILDTSTREKGVMPIAAGLRARWRPDPAYVPTPELIQVAEWIEARYQLAGVLMPNGWIIWVHRDRAVEFRSLGRMKS